MLRVASQKNEMKKTFSEVTALIKVKVSMNVTLKKLLKLSDYKTLQEERMLMFSLHFNGSLCDLTICVVGYLFFCFVRFELRANSIHV